MTKEIETLVAQMGETESTMDKYWQELIPIHRVVEAMHNSGMTWRDLSLSEIEKLPQRKADVLRHNDMKLFQEEKDKQDKLDEKVKKQYYQDNFEALMVAKMENNEFLDESEIRDLLEYEIHIDEGENNRWTQDITSILELTSFSGETALYCVYWERGLTEYQENTYMEQPFKVKRVEREITTVQITYEPI